jgi:hypothetical protein
MLSHASQPIVPPLPLAIRFKRFISFIALGMGFLVYAQLTYQRNLPIMCPYRRITGKRCPFCGLTTATGHLLHGKPRQMAQSNPFTPWYLLAVFAWFLKEGYTLIVLNSWAKERI